MRVPDHRGRGECQTGDGPRRRPPRLARLHRRACARPTRARRGDAAAPGASRRRGRVARAREVRTFALHRPGAGPRRRARRARRARSAASAPRAILYSSTHGGAAVAAAGRDPLRRAGGGQPARAATGSGSGRSSARRLRGGAAARAVERGGAGRGAGAARRGAGRAGAGRRRLGPAGGPRDIAAITYGANPHKKGLDRVLAAWRARAAAGRGARRRRACSGAPARTASATRAWSRRPSTARCCAARGRSSPPRGARTTASPSSRRSPTAACSSRRAAPGPYAALPLARALDPRLVGDDLAGAIRTALDDPLPGYAERAARPRSRRLTRAAVDRIVADRAACPALLARTLDVFLSRSDGAGGGPS